MSRIQKYEAGEHPIVPTVFFIGFYCDYAMSGLAIDDIWVRSYYCCVTIVSLKGKTDGK